MQGRITKVLNMKPPEILSLLEEAASTKLYEHKKGAALKTIEKKDSKLREIDRVLREDITPTVRKLREERSSYLEYQKIVREIEHLSKFICAYDFTCLEQAKLQTKKDLQKLESILMDERQKLELIKKEKNDLEEKILQFREERDKRQGPALEEAEKVHSDCQKAEAVASGTSQRSIETVQASKRLLKGLEAQYLEVSSQLANTEKEVCSAGGANFQATEEEAQKAQEDLTKAQSWLEATTSGLSRSDGGVSASLAEQARCADGHCSSLETRLRQLGMREAHLGAELVATQRALDDLPGGHETAEEAGRKKISSQVEALTRELTALRTGQAMEQQDETMLADGHRRLAKEARDLQAKCDIMAGKLLHFQAEYSDPEANFDRSRILGSVARLFELTDLKYASAIEVVAGAKMQSIVVDTERTAKLLLERGQFRRRVTLLPLNQMRGSRLPEEVVERAKHLVGADNVSPALSLVVYPPRILTVMEFVLGGTLVCPTLDIARRVAFHPDIHRRTVTHEGDIFDPQGTLSGGSRAPASTSVLARIAEWRKLEGRVTEAMSATEEAAQRLNRAREQSARITSLQDQLSVLQHELGILDMNMRQSDRHRILSDIEGLQGEMGQVREETAALREELRVAKGHLDEARWKVSHAQEEREKQLKMANSALQEAQKRFEEASSLLRQKLSLRDRLSLEAEELRSDLRQLEANKQEALAELKLAETEAEQQALDLTVAREALATAKAAVREQQRLAETAAKATSLAEAEASRLNEEQATISSSIDRSTHRLEMQTKETREANQRLLQMQEENPWIAEEKQYFGSANGTYDFEARDPSEARKRITQLSTRRDKLSRTVNMRAMNMLGSAEEQYAELLRRQEIVLTDKRKIQEVIDDLDCRKEEVLKRAYEKVNNEFCNIFSSLLPGSRAKLVPPEGQTILDGLEFRISFGDTWKESLTELSGGQRSLVALALILALLLFKPAPIYILDEVDAALDLSHTQNIGQLIKNHFKHSQFLVVSLKDGMFNNANVLFKTKFVDGVSTVSRHVPLKPAGLKPRNERTTRKGKEMLNRICV